MTVTRRVEICNQRGLHARASAAFSRLAQKYQCAITVERNGFSADGKSIMELLSLGASKGSEVLLTAIGDDAEPAVQMLSELVENRFGEEI